MSNPDEKTAVEQFGTGDKHFGVATLMATMPGLPMLGHGQLEGFSERYGMEFSRAAWDEPIDDGMLARYEREIVPLLHRRGIFAGSRDFLLFDVVGDDGSVREDVFAYSNIGPGGERSLIVYNNRYGGTDGRIRESVGFSAVDPASGERGLRRRSLADGLGIWLGGPDEPGLEGLFVRARSAIAGLEYLWPARDLVVGGMWLDLGPYDYRVYLDWATVRDADGRWARLHASLGGRGVPSLDGELLDIELVPVHEALAAVLDGADSNAAETLIAAVRGATGARRGAPDATVAEAIRSGVVAVDGMSFEDPTAAAAFRARAAIEPLGRLGDAGDTRDTARAWFSELRLGPALVRTLGADAPTPGRVGRVDPERAAHRTWLLLGLTRPDQLPAGDRAPALHLAEAWLADPDVAAYLDVHESDGIRWLSAERLAEIADWVLALDVLDAPPRPSRRRSAPATGTAGSAIVALRRTAREAGYRVDEWLRLLAPRDGSRRAGTTKTAKAAPKPAAKAAAPNTQSAAVADHRGDGPSQTGRRRGA